jgi:hypothetical protein
MSGGKKNMVDKSDEILSAIAGLRNEVSEQIAGAVRTLQQTISAKLTDKSPASIPTPVPAANNKVLARQLKQYATDALVQLGSVLEQAKQKGQDVVAVQKLISRVGKHENSSEDDLASGGSLFLRTEIEKLQTTMSVVKTSIASAAKTATTAIPFPPSTRRSPSETTAAKKSSEPAVKRTTVPSTEQQRSNPATVKEKRAMAASAKAS